jgi:hypothetical protein
LIVGIFEHRVQPKAASCELELSDSSAGMGVTAPEWWNRIFRAQDICVVE